MSCAAATTSQTELRLVNLARASLEELLLDYEDFLRQRKLRTWAKNDAEAQAVRSVGWQNDRTDPSDPVAHWQVYARWLEHADPGVVANTLADLPDSSGELSAGPADQRAGTGLCPRRRLQRTTGDSATGSATETGSDRSD